MNPTNQNGNFWSALPWAPRPLKTIRLPGSILKWIAIITMFIDHFAVAVISRQLRVKGFAYKQELYSAYQIFRDIGRMGFPLFCFLLVEGLIHTRNRAKYAFRLFIFCFLSEMPFDLALFNSRCTWEHQNVFFTLFIGYAAIWAIDEIRHRTKSVLLTGISIPALVAGACYLAEFLHTDYRGYGVLTIVVMYFFHFNNVISLLAGLLVLSGFNHTEIPAFFTLISMSFYDGTRGKQMKYFFYAFYPVHLALLYLSALVLGIVT